LTPAPGLQLGRLAGISSYFAVQDGPADLANGWHPAASLLDDDGRLLGEAVDSIAARLAAPRRWIGASILFQGWAARLTSIYVGCLTLDGAAPDLAITRIHYRVPATGAVDMIIDPVVTLDADRAWRRILDDHLHPLADAFRAHARVGRRILEGNIASSLGGSLSTLARTGHGSLADLISRPWAQPPDLAAYGSWAQNAEDPRYVRTTCCGYERIPGGGRCGDCSLTARGVASHQRPSRAKAADS
jgi:iron complex transport system ATP-binding protein